VNPVDVDVLCGEFDQKNSAAVVQSLEEAADNYEPAIIVETEAEDRSRSYSK